MVAPWTPRMLKWLVEGGWFPGRRVDLAAYRAHLGAAGYALSPAVAECLAEFGGLTIRYPIAAPFPHLGIFASLSGLHLDAIRAEQGVAPERVIGDYSARAGEPLCPVGEGFSQNSVLPMARSGALYSAFDDSLVQVGAAPRESLAAIFERRRPRRVP